MLSIPPTVSIFLYTEPTDLRKGFDGLSGIVRSELAADPLDGSLFLFINRRRDRLKILHFDGSGYRLYYKLLEGGNVRSHRCRGQVYQHRLDATGDVAGRSVAGQCEAAPTLSACFVTDRVAA